MTALLVRLLAIGPLIYVVIGAVQAAWRSRIGLNDVSILAADDTRIGSPTLRSDRLGLVGRPDHLVGVDGYLIPLEQKARAQRVHNSHVMQCLLVSDVYGTRPPYGLLVLADGAS